MDGRTIILDWGMHTAEGNQLLTSKMEALLADMRDGQMTRAMLEPRRSAIMRQVKFAGHPEVYDATVRKNIYTAIDIECDAHGWHRIDE